jgi:hypothetical protein
MRSPWRRRCTTALWLRGRETAAPCPGAKAQQPGSRPTLKNVLEGAPQHWHRLVQGLRQRQTQGNVLEGIGERGCLGVRGALELALVHVREASERGEELRGWRALGRVAFEEIPCQPRAWSLERGHVESALLRQLVWRAGKDRAA